jgi:hypothetical protein
VEVFALAAGAGLLFEDDEVSGPGAGRVECAGFGAGPGVGVLVEERIGVKAEDVEVAREGAAVVDGFEQAVMGDEPLRLDGAEDFDLLVLEAGGAPGEEAAVVDDVCGVQVGGGVGPREGDLVIGAVGLGPEGGAPGAVQGGDVGPVLVSEEVDELLAAVGAVALGEVAIDFVIGLPADDVGVVATVDGEGAGDVAGVVAEDMRG